MIVPLANPEISLQSLNLHVSYLFARTGSVSTDIEIHTLRRTPNLPNAPDVIRNITLGPPPSFPLLVGYITSREYLVVPKNDFGIA